MVTRMWKDLDYGDTNHDGSNVAIVEDIRDGATSVAAFSNDIVS